MMPRLLLLLLFGLAGLPLIPGIWYPAATGLGMLLTVTVLGLALADRLLSPSPNNVTVQRDVREVLSVGARNPVRLWLENHNVRPVRVEIHDEPPQPGEADDLPTTIDLSPRRRRSVLYHARPHHRGRNRFGQVFLRIRSRWGFWTLQDERLLDHPVRIYPDIQAVHGVELLARQNRLAEAGVRLSRLRGRGYEFDRLREYRREDEYRSIDWKATARQEKLISREYVVERNQNILFLLDCGRSMCNELAGITHFDRALNAALLLSYVALRQGDTVGMLCCSNRLERWLSPVRGAGGIQTLIRHTYDLKPRYEAADYALMVEQLRRRYRKRSLVIHLTHALDDVHLASIAQHMHGLLRPHLVLNAFLRNVPLVERAHSQPETDLDAFQIAAAAGMVARQSRQMAELQKSGLLVLETLPDSLSTRLVNQYLDIKARHLL